MVKQKLLEAPISNKTIVHYALEELNDALNKGWKVVQATPIIDSRIVGATETTTIIYVLEKDCDVDE